MKRHAIALLVHFYKECLLPRKLCAERLNDCVKSLVANTDAFPNIKFNLAMPACFLEIMDPLLLLRLREMNKRGQAEWLFTGYTEPFLSFSLPWLLRENLKHGMTVFEELLGEAPSGLALPFANWEPAAVAILRASGIHYCVASKALLPEEYRSLCGYWMTEHMGSSVALVPATVVSGAGAAAGLFDTLDLIFNADHRKSQSGSDKILCVDLLCPLSQPLRDTEAILGHIFRTFDKMLLSYQAVRCMDFCASHFPVGLHHFPPGLVCKRDDMRYDPQLLNYLHTFDQVGIIQRKLMDISESLASRKETKAVLDAKRSLFFVQDISHFLPSSQGGFLQAADRQWCFSKMIEIERRLFAKEEIKGGHIRITDLLKNGAKTIIMTNKNLSVSIDYRSGGQVFEIDYKNRDYNVCAALGLSRHKLPMIIEAPLSRTAFIDHCLPLETTAGDFFGGRRREYGDFATGDFGYKVKKTGAGIKAVLQRNGTLLQGEKLCPMNVEKVVGLEKDLPILSFVYQLSNHSLTSYAFRFAVESTFSFPGIRVGKTGIVMGKKTHDILAAQSLSLDSAAEWAIDDAWSGIRLRFVMQKPVDVWFSAASAAAGAFPYASDALTMVITAAVTLEGSKAWSLMGTAIFKRLRAEQEATDEI